MAIIKKETLVTLFSKKTGIPKYRARPIVNVLFSILVRVILEMQVDDELTLRGFGTWKIKKRKARDNARNPKTGEQVFLPPRRVVVWEPARFLKNELARKLNPNIGRPLNEN